MKLVKEFEDSQNDDHSKKSLTSHLVQALKLVGTKKSSELNILTKLCHAKDWY
jgi:hypothetical protein